MADTSRDALPRLADALSEVGTRLSEIGDELRALRLEEAVAAPPARQVAGTPPLPATETREAREDGEVRAATKATAAPEVTEGTAATEVAAAAAAQAAPPQAVPHQAGPSETVPPDAVPHQASPPEAVPQQAGPPAAVPQQAGPPDAEPHQAVPQQAGPHRAAPPQAVPAQPGPAHSGPAHSTPRQPGPGQSTPPQAAPPRAVPPVPYPGQRWHPPPTRPVRPPALTLWQRLGRDGAGSRLLAWAGGVVTLAGVVLLLVLAIQRGYLGPLPRVLLGAGLGLALTGIGLRLHRNPAARVGAYALAATGIAVLYLDVVAATTLYGFLPPVAGLLTGLVVAGGGIALAGRWSAQPFAVFVVVGCALCAPFLAGGDVALLLGFLLVLKVATTPVQLRRRWRVLGLAAGLPPILASLVGIVFVREGGNGLDPTTAALLCLATSVLVLAAATVTDSLRPGDDAALTLLLLSPAPAMVAALLLPRAGAALLPGVVGVLLVGVWVLHRFGPLSPRFALAAGGAGALAVLQATATAVDGAARPVVILGEALLLTLLATRLRDRETLVPAAVFGVTGLLLALVFTLPPAMLVAPPRREPTAGELVASGLGGLLLGALAIAFCLALVRFGVLPEDGHGPHGWTTAGVLVLYGAAAAVLSVGLLISPDRTGFLVGHVLVTVSWTFGALVLLLRGIDSVPLRVAGLALVAAALGKLVLFDLASLDGIARVAAFLVAGLVLLAAGARYARLVSARADA